MELFIGTVLVVGFLIPVVEDGLRDLANEAAERDSLTPSVVRPFAEVDVALDVVVLPLALLPPEEGSLRIALLVLATGMADILILMTCSWEVWKFDVMVGIRRRGETLQPLTRWLHLTKVDRGKVQFRDSYYTTKETGLEFRYHLYLHRQG